MKNIIYRIAQEAPGGAPPPPMDAPPPPDAMGGMPPMDPMLGGGMGAPPPPGAPAAGPGGAPSEPILTPLDSVGAILKDYGIENALKTKLSNSSRIGSTGEQEIAMLVWRTYGGDVKGGVVPGRVGERDYENALEEPEQLKIIKDPDMPPIQNRWVRLPEGMSLDDLDITLDNILQAVTAASISTSISSGKAAAGGGGGGGAMASAHDKFVKVARQLDQAGLYHLADKMFNFD